MYPNPNPIPNPNPWGRRLERVEVCEELAQRVLVQVLGVTATVDSLRRRLEAGLGRGEEESDLHAWCDGAATRGVHSAEPGRCTVQEWAVLASEAQENCSAGKKEA